MAVARLCLCYYSVGWVLAGHLESNQSKICKIVSESETKTFPTSNRCRCCTSKFLCVQCDASSFNKSGRQPHTASASVSFKEAWQHVESLGGAACSDTDTQCGKKLLGTVLIASRNLLGLDCCLIYGVRKRPRARPHGLLSFIISFYFSHLFTSKAVNWLYEPPGGVSTCRGHLMEIEGGAVEIALRLEV